MRLYLFPIFAVIVNAAIDFYIYAKLKRAWRPKPVIRAHTCLSTLPLIMLLAAVAALSTGFPRVPLRGIMWMIFVYLTIYIPKYFGMITAAVLSVPKLVGRKAPRRTSTVALVVGAIVFIAMWWGSIVTRYSVQTREVTIERENIPAQFDGYRIAQFSDIHLGSYGSDTAFISRVVDNINALNPDLICFTGDIVNSHTDEAYPFKQTLSRLKAPDGVMSILGNHDYGDYNRWHNPIERDINNAKLEQLERDMGWTLLNNTSTVISRGNDSIAIIGVENWGEPPFPKYGRLSDAYPDLNDNAFKILLSHNPKHWQMEVVPTSNIDITLAGHTHAMQVEIDLPGGRRMSIARLKYKEWGGLYQNGRQLLYVNTGIGQVAVPMRIGATPEITLITLKSKPQP